MQERRPDAASADQTHNSSFLMHKRFQIFQISKMSVLVIQGVLSKIDEQLVYQGSTQLDLLVAPII